jgi:hypothetical protein
MTDKEFNNVVKQMKKLNKRFKEAKTTKEELSIIREQNKLMKKSADRLEKELGKKYPTAVTYEEIDGIDYVNGIERKYCFS